MDRTLGEWGRRREEIKKKTDQQTHKTHTTDKTTTQEKPNHTRERGRKEEKQGIKKRKNQWKST